MVLELLSLLRTFDNFAKYIKIFFDSGSSLGQVKTSM